MNSLFRLAGFIIRPFLVFFNFFASDLVSLPLQTCSGTLPREFPGFNIQLLYLQILDSIIVSFFLRFARAVSVFVHCHLSEVFCVCVSNFPECFWFSFDILACCLVWGMLFAHYAHSIVAPRYLLICARSKYTEPTSYCHCGTRVDTAIPSRHENYPSSPQPYATLPQAKHLRAPGTNWL